MGEWSRKVGEKGEKIVEYFFNEILGYKTALDDETIECIKGEKHKTNKSKKTTHGVDGLVSSVSPLEDNVLEIGVISVKYTSKKYPNSPKTEFKKHIRDLAYTLECFKYSKLLSNTKKQFQNIDRTDITGILVWTSNKSENNENIISKFSNSILDNDLLFDKIIVIDNDRLTFFVDTVLNIKEKFGEENVKFVYHNTNLNTNSLTSMSYGQFLPINYLYSNIIPLRISNNGEIELLICSKDNFNIKHLHQLLHFAKSFDHLDSTNKVILSFPEYNELDNISDIKSALMNYDKYELNKNLFLKTHISNFKNF